MSLYLRLTIGPVIVCDLELFGTTTQHKDDSDPPPQLNGGQGTVVEPWVESPAVFGFHRQQGARP